MVDTPAKLSRRVLAFFGTLREEHGFGTSAGEARDALRGLEVLGISDAGRVRSTLRCVACGSPEQIAIFDAAYDDVFLASDDGAEQDSYAPKHSRPGSPPQDAETSTTPERRDPADDSPGEGEAHGPAREKQLAPEQNDAMEAWLTLRARYSASAASSEPPRIEAAGLEAMESAARRLVRSIRLGRSRRLTPQPHGPRLDPRRTLRASLQTAGEPLVLHRLGAPRRAPRIVLLIDGSRSMADAAPTLLQFAYALGQATRRARTYSFSTELHDLTRALRQARPGEELPSLGESWGGGTRIGANLARFVREYGPRALDDQTLVIVASDGLDAGDAPQLERAMREIRRRSAAVVWLNPHASSHGFAPIATGMRAAAPFVDILDCVTGARDVERLAERLSAGGSRA